MANTNEMESWLGKHQPQKCTPPLVVRGRTRHFIPEPVFLDNFFGVESMSSVAFAFAAHKRSWLLHQGDSPEDGQCDVSGESVHLEGRRVVLVPRAAASAVAPASPMLFPAAGTKTPGVHTKPLCGVRNPVRMQTPEGGQSQDVVVGRATQMLFWN